MDDQNKNLILAVVLSGIVLLAWTYFFPAPDPVIDPNAPATVQTSDGTDVNGETIALAPPSTDTLNETTGVDTSTVEQTASAPRIDIETDRVEGSISLIGGRIDDLSLKDYSVEIDSDELVTLLTPVGSAAPYYAVYGWAPGGSLAPSDVPGANTEWQVESGDRLTVGSPVTLRWDNGKGLTFRREIAIDSDYLFTITQSVENTGEAPERMAAYGIVARHGTPDVSRYFVLHEGLVRQNDKELEEADYKDMADYDFVEREGAMASVEQIEENGWIGFTDKNWMTTLVPEPGQPFTSVAKYVSSSDIYQVESRMPAQTVAPGETASTTTYLFAGAKEWETIKRYEEEKGFFRFIDSIDWGWFFFFTKPIFWLLHNLNALIGNMGWSIIALTLIIKAIMFPLAL